MYSYLKDNILEVKTHINTCAESSGRKVEDVLLIGVTKTYEADVMNAAIGYGITDIAENRVQEILRKYDAVTPGVNWHLIGHLQTNKVKYIIDKVDLIHSVDSEKLAIEIDKRAGQIHKIQDVLIQVNVANEEQKSGISPEELPILLKCISSLPNIRVLGLMNIAPFTSDRQAIRADFKQMKSLLDTLEKLGYDNVKAKHLSMGMSGDYDIAIEEGATMIRVGTKIFGPRDYSNK